MSTNQNKHFFPGGNTSQGFFSYYDYILRQEEAKEIFIIKGGPGVGKSTFIKRIAKQVAENGYNIEFMHCSSDNDSLDGIMIPQLKIAIIDGTAPHIVEPKNPGAVDTIINFGEFWDEKVIRNHKSEILRDTLQTKMCFESAYRYLKAASLICDDSSEIYNLAIDHAIINKISLKLVSQLFQEEKTSDKTGNDRRLFASAITPNGLKNYLNTVLTTKKVIGIIGAKGTGAEHILEKIKRVAIEKGFNVESYYCALYPNTLEHLIIPDLNFSLTTINEYHKADIHLFDTINLNVEINKDNLRYNKIEFEKLLNRAIEKLGEAKAIHDQLETYYVASVNFKKINKCYNRIIDRILSHK